MINLALSLDDIEARLSVFKIENQQNRTKMILSTFRGLAASTNLTRLDWRLPVYVHLLGDLPRHPPILLETEVESEIWRTSWVKFRSASLWLETSLLGLALPQEARELPFVDYEWFAEFLSAYFRLTVAVHAQTACPKVLAFPTPADLWFYSCVAFSIYELEIQGLTDIPFVRGKREITDRGLKDVSDFRQLSFKPDYAIDFCSEPMTHVVLEAQTIACTDKSFYMQHLLPFLQVARKSIKKLNKSKEIQFLFRLPDGKQFRTGEKKKLPVSKRL